MQIKIHSLSLHGKEIDFTFKCMYYTNRIIEIHSKKLLEVYKSWKSPLKEKIFSEVLTHLKSEMSTLFSRPPKWQGMSLEVFIEEESLEISLEFEL